MKIEDVIEGHLIGEEIKMDSVSEARLASVCPQLADKIRQMATMLATENIVIRVTQGLRTWDEQQALYNQGRTTPGKIVTNAQPGYSYHNFGLAVDCVIMNSDNLPDWNSTHPAWKRMISVGESLGLVSGSEWRTFPDFPHFQLTGVLPVSPNNMVRELYKDSGMQAVWAKATNPIPVDVSGEISV